MLLVSNMRQVHTSRKKAKNHEWAAWSPLKLYPKTNELRKIMNNLDTTSSSIKLHDRDDTRMTAHSTQNAQAPDDIWSYTKEVRLYFYFVVIQVVLTFHCAGLFSILSIFNPRFRSQRDTTVHGVLRKHIFHSRRDTTVRFVLRKLISHFQWESTVPCLLTRKIHFLS